MGEGGHQDRGSQGSSLEEGTPELSLPGWIVIPQA